MTASAHVLVFRPLIELMRARGDEVEITARDYAQTLQLLELHGLEADGDRQARWALAHREGARAGLRVCAHSAAGRKVATSTSRSRTARTS